ncbi:MAG: T9SS type A sorting domain-containing protein [Bacteroidetes bacterium]|nr:T9SS type A sorting domain-containing protein [Bacteroidota bacterium]
MPGSLSGTTVTVSPASTTTYTVTGTTGNGCTATATRTITVNPSPTVTTTTTGAAICSGSSTTITASGATTYAWMPGSLSGATVTVSPASTTTYTVTGTTGLCSGTTTQMITVNPNPGVTSSSSSPSVCQNGNVTLTASGATTYNWMPGSMSGTSITVTPLSTTTYTVTGTDVNGCSNTSTLTITVNSLPTVTASSSSSTVCSGSAVTLTASGASTYNWMPINVNGNPVTGNPVSNTTYTVTGTDAVGCSSTATVIVNVNALPNVTASESATSVCTGDAVTLSASGANTYLWQPINTTGATVTDVPASTTTYTVTGTDLNGCANTAQETVTVNPLPIITATGDSLICEGNSANLSASGATNYTWNPGALNGSTVAVSPAATTSYTVLGTDANGCNGSATFTVTVDTPPVAGNIIINGTTLTSSVVGTTYQWYLNGNPVSGATSQSYTATQNGTYTVEVFDAAGCGSGQSSGVTDPTGISVSSSVEFINLYPNPNNGHFTLNFNLTEKSDCTVDIYNALGQLIYREALGDFSGEYKKDLDLSNYGKGVYSVRLKTGTKELAIKTIVY